MTNTHEMFTSHAKSRCANCANESFFLLSTSAPHHQQIIWPQVQAQFGPLSNFVMIQPLVKTINLIASKNTSQFATLLSKYNFYSTDGHSLAIGLSITVSSLFCFHFHFTGAMRLATLRKQLAPVLLSQESSE